MVGVVAADEPESASDTKPKVTTVSGTFEAIRSHSLAAETEQLKALKIKKILPHGSEVTKGQNVVWFETEDADKQIKEAARSLRLAELTFQDEELGYQQFQESQKLDKAAADRTFQKAKQDYDNFVQVDLERQIESAHFSLKNAIASRDNVMEELTQLEQMYREDDLTEESEEIVLKRAKQAVENAEFRLKGTRVSTERALKQSIPRSRAEKDAAFTRAQLAHAKSMHGLNTARQRREIEMNQKQEKLQETQDDFKKLQQERKKLVVRAPADGIVFHGKLSRGKVSDKPSTLAEGTSVTNKQVLATLAEPGKLQIRVDLQEKDLTQVVVGAKGKVKVAAYPDRDLTATVKSVSKVPYAGTKYDCVLAVKMPRVEPAIVPGMTCTIEFTPEAKD